MFWLFLILAQTTEQGLFETLTSAAVQVPALAVLVVVVYVFLAHIKDSNKQQEQRELSFHKALSERDEHLSEIGDSCHEFHKDLIATNREFNKQLSEECRAVIRENSQVVKDNTIALTGIRNELMKKGNMGS